MDKLEAKHLKHYLGTGLACKLKFDGKQEFPWYYEKDEDDLFELEGMMLDWYGNAILEIKPILLPLSALTEPLKDGSIPIVELAKIAESQHFNLPLNVKHDEISNVSLCEFYSKETGEFIIFCYIHNQNAFYLRSEKRGDALVMINQLQLFEYLFANHFDVYGLIDAGLAIDKRTI